MACTTDVNLSANKSKVDMSKLDTVEKYKLENKVLNDLEKLLKGGWKEAGLTQLPDNYFSIEDILTLPSFSHLTWGDFREATHADSELRFSVRGSKIRLKPPELNKDPDVILSKKLAWILRHGAENEGFTFEDGGYLNIDEIMRIKQFGSYSYIDLKRVVDENDKKRFEIRANVGNSRLQLRATQGHSVKIEGLDMRLVDDPYLYPVVIHGTYWQNWEAIRRTGLKRMGRTHIHFAIGEAGEDGVISGMRGSAEIIIHLDLPKAIKDGLHFHISTNNVILCEGDETGTILPKYFKSVFQRNSGKQISMEEIENSTRL